MLRRLHQLEDFVLASLLMSMIVLAVLQIGLRNFAGMSLTWIDPLLRVEVLWLGLLGAASAARGGRHITIDILDPLLSSKRKLMLARVANVAAALVCAAVAWYSAQFVMLEMEYPTPGILGLSTWQQQLVIPFSFGLMGLRFLLMAVLVGDEPKPATEEHAGADIKADANARIGEGA